MAIQPATEMPIHRLDVDTYHRLAEAGALDGLDVELLDGLLVDRDCGREDPVHRIDVGTYDRMVASGALEGRRIELVDGLLIEMSPKSADHVLVVGRLVRHFAAQSRWWTQVQDPIEAAYDSEPEPDLVLSEHEPSQGRLLHTAALVIEVAVSSHALDRGRKAALYAQAGIPVYWLVDVPGRAVEVRVQPGPDGYARCETHREGEIVPCPLDGVADLDLAALLAGVNG